MSHNVDVIRGAYDAFAEGDVPAVLSAMAPDIEWNEAENFPYPDGNPYIGPDAVVEGVFTRLGQDWDFRSIWLVERVEQRAEPSHPELGCESSPRSVSSRSSCEREPGGIR